MSIKGKVKNDNSITYKIEYDEPIEIGEFTKSLTSFSDEYKKFIREEYGSEQPIEAKLYIEKISEGSIETTLVEYAILGVPFLQEINTIYEFGKHIKGVFAYFLGKEKLDEVPKYDVETLKNLKAILEPGTKPGNTTIININAPNNNLVVLNADDIEASALINRFEKEKKLLETPASNIHIKQAFYFDQAKKDIGSKSGNFGVVENLYPFKLKVIFEDDKLDKALMLHGDHNPLMATYIVDLEVQMVKEMPKIYKILKLHEIIPDDE